MELDKVDKNGNIENYDTKIDGIIDRISILKTNLYTKLAFNKSAANNINFVKALNENKIILIKAREEDFTNRSIRDLIATFYLSKVWLAKQISAKTKTNIFIEKWQKKNKYGRPGTSLNYTKVAIHYTGQADVKGSATVSYFNNVVANGTKVNGRYIYASAHYVIDLDGTIYQLIPINEMCYATNSANSYAVGIEVATTGKDNHYTDATYRSMVQLCAWLCDRKGLNCKKDIIRHTDVVGRAYKLCPIYMVLNPKKYEQFKLELL